MHISTKWLVLWSLWAARLVRQPTAPLRVSSGLLRGSVAHDGSHVAYLGIPYASLPQENRFEGPGPEPIWDGVYEAVDGNKMCLQCSMNPIKKVALESAVGQEDCLKINVYTPSFPLNYKLPVMVFIHGGGFIEGSGGPIFYGPNYLVTKGVILVTFNYRLSVHGYLNLGIKEAPGNAGLKDQVAALRWIQMNIRVFGGDPDNVTIFGESTGGASVSYHLLSPMSKGLFHQAITQSGSSLCPWAFQATPEYNAHLVAKALGYNIKDPQELHNFFNSMPLRDLVGAKIPKDERKLLLASFIYAPSVEKEFEGVESFLTEEPYKLLEQGKFYKVPMIIGTTDEEGYFFIGAEHVIISNTVTVLEHSLPNNLNFPSESEKRRVADEIREMYMGDEQKTFKIFRGSFFYLSIIG